MTLPITRTEPLCFCHVDGCRKAGGAKMAVGEGAASCELKAPCVSSVTRALSLLQSVIALQADKIRELTDEAEYLREQTPTPPPDPFDC